MATVEDNQADIVVIGAGIAGASVAAELAGSAKVVMLEMERQPGYHTTGRSAAVFAPCYGPTPIRELTRASESFFRNPPVGFTDTSLFAPRPILMIARPEQRGVLEALTEALSRETRVQRLSGDELAAHQPMLRPDYASDGMLDEMGQDIDVHALHQGYLRQFRALGGTLETGAEVTALEREGDDWCVITKKGTLRAPVVVNAAGAWADVVGQMAGAERIALTPKRRTAMMIADHPTIATADLPITIDVEEQFYLKPDAGRLLISPADETPSAPCDAQPEELDIAICADRIMTAFDLDIRRIENSWSGLRSFVPDGVPVVGYSDVAQGFFWLAGQGGYGIQSAPGLAQYAAAAIQKREMPARVMETGFDPASVSPERLEVAA
ncbi:NAD(P)/FAD-dependent oxidoreductase [Shimia aestuarii]|uniref:NAD(P)/FAD-dependent oxidoreductase n=1 Tax=Shimia aestuarii TaxID=254406 RepID=UPI001FB35E0C|nr:FAD-binding oxidoreductase [Shimia aestuarii]